MIGTMVPIATPGGVALAALATPTLTAEASGPVSLGNAIHDTAYLSGGSGSLTGTVQFQVYAPADTTCATPLIASPVDVPVAATIFGQDAFDRTSATSWGTADVGGIWSATGAESATAFSVSPTGFGMQTTTTSGDTAVAGLPGTIQDVDAKVRVKFDQGTLPGSTLENRARILVRSEVASDSRQYDYEFALNEPPDGKNLQAFIRKRESGSGSDQLLAWDTDTLLPQDTGSYFWIRGQVSGTSAVTLRLKVWKDGTAEPAAWNATYVDTTPAVALQGPGHVDLSSYGNDNLPLTVHFAEFQASTPAYTSADFIPPTVGEYHWRATYSGDANNNPVSTACGVLGQDSLVTAAVPGAPTIGTATRGDTQATVTWTAPASDGGSAITGYTATSTPGGKTCTTATTSCTVTGLTNGTSYTFTVTATNAVGTGPASAASNSVTPAAVPGAPTIGTATRGDTQATVTWTAPASDGGSAITGYTATSTPGGKTCTTATTSCTVTGLTNGTSYTFTVTATNAVGTGPASAASNSVTPAAVPGAPTIGTATRGDTQATVTWTAPASDGGSAITGYTATSTPGGKTCTTATTSCTVTGLTNGTAYTFTVTATNAVGTGPASAASNSVTPAAVPGAPTIGTATRGDTQATVTWTAPASDGGSAITGYTATSTPGGKTCTTATTSCTVTGLTNGTAYTFTVAATNAVGTGPASAASNSVTPAAVPGAPTIGTATRGDTQATVTWTAPASDGGSAITGYTATSTPGGKTCTTATTSCTVTGLTNGTSYTFTVAATNVVGTGPQSAASNSVTPAAVPGAPTGVTASPGNLSALVSWTAAAANGATITGYTVTSSPGGKTCTTAGTSCTVTGLTNGTSYTFTVRATNAVGTGPASAASSAVTPSPLVTRYAGTSRFDTAAAISAHTFSPGVGVAYIATAYNFPDALAGAAAAGTVQGPVLLVAPTGAINPATATELTRLHPGKIIVLGGTGVVSEAVKTALGTYTTGTVTRYAGTSRFDTAAAISAHTFSPGVGVAYIATAYNFPDALAGAAAAGTVQGPVLLVAPTGAINPATATELTRLHPGRIIVLGGTGVVSEAVKTALGTYTTGTVTRYAGTSRFDTAAAISAHTFSPGVGVAYIATAYNFPDALAGAAAAGTVQGPVLLVAPTGAINPATATELTRLHPGRIIVLGGTGVVSEAVKTALGAYATGP